MPDVLLATCNALPEGDEDGALLLQRLAEIGVRARWVPWTHESTDWADTPVVLRSTWDYTLDRARFLAWLDRLEHVHNPARIVLWNSDKIYLHDLDVAGVPITPTTVAVPGEAIVIPESREFVVKPSVGAGSRGAGRFTASRTDDARAHATMLHRAGRTVLVQPYLDGVDDHGETALIYFDGTFSHAICKGAMLAAEVAHPLEESSGLYLEENISAREPSDAERAVGTAALAVVTARFGAAPLYARVDLLPSAAGPVVVELELTEPSLFLQYGIGSDPARAFAIAIAERL